MSNNFIFGVVHKNDLKGTNSWEHEELSDFYKIHKEKSFIKIKKRTSYPGTFLREKNGKKILGYQEPNIEFSSTKKLKEERKEFFHISASPSSVKITRDEFCTIPVFYFSDDDFFVFSNNFSSTFLSIKEGAGNINFRGLAEYLLLLEEGDRTLIDGLKTAIQKSELLFNINGLHISLPKDAPIPSIKNRSNPFKKFSKKLEKTLELYNKKIPQNVKIGIELSGGADSAIVAEFFARKRDNIKAYSMLLPGDIGERQRRKLDKFAEFLDIDHVVVEVENEHPLKRFLSSGLKPLYPKQEIYTEALTAMLLRAKKDGVEVMTTGMGGDELFIIDPREEEGHQGDKEANFRKEIDLPPFFTKTFKSNFLKSITNKKAVPIPAVPHSVLSAHTSRNNIFISNNIWPIAPLADADLAYFCRGFSNKERKNKKLLREYEKKKGFPKEIYDPKRNEHFGQFFSKHFKETLYEFASSLYKESILSSLNLINKKELLSEYEKIRKSRSSIRPIFLYNIAVVEIILQSLKKENESKRFSKRE